MRISKTLPGLLVALAASGCADRGGYSQNGPQPQLSISLNYFLLVDREGDLWAWGDNNFGQLGDGTTDSQEAPEFIGSGYVAAVTSATGSLALKADGTLWDFGSTASGRSGADPVQIGSGYSRIDQACDHAAGIKADGSLWVWGRNGFGAIGDGSGAPVREPKLIGQGYADVQLTCGFSMALKADGSVWTWGRNDNGQIGDGSHADAATPRQVATDVVAIFAGDQTAFAIKKDGSLWGWGLNDAAQLGLGTTTDSAVPVRLGEGYRSLSAGWHTVAAVKTDGSLWEWGLHPERRRANDASPPGSAVPVKLGDGYGSVSVGGNVIAALTTSGVLRVWGSRLTPPNPSHKPADAGHGYVSVQADRGTVYAMRSDGSLWHGTEEEEGKELATRKIRLVAKRDECPSGPFATDLDAIRRAMPPPTESLPLETNVTGEGVIERIRNGGRGASGGGLQVPGSGSTSSMWGFDADRAVFVSVVSYRYGPGDRIAEPYGNNFPRQLSAPQATRLVRRSQGRADFVTMTRAKPEQVHQFSCTANVLLSKPLEVDNVMYSDAYYKSFCVLKNGKCLNEDGLKRRPRFWEERLDSVIDKALEGPFKMQDP